ncbi:MAG: molecular chaperone DnaK [Patescibacteria group bacterium]
MSIVLGIDLGTTNSAMAYVVGGEPKIIENVEGTRTTPSVVAINKDDSESVGGVAYRSRVLNPEFTFYEVKRLIGRSYKESEEDIRAFSFKVADKGDKVKVVGRNNKEYSPEEISAKVLRKLKTDAEQKLGQTITEAVITVPAYFNDSQRQATKDAGEIAGLKVLRIVNEPTAAALAYGLDKKQDEKILVYDLGGGTFDVTVLEIGEGTIEVKATNGDTHLGGHDFDKAITDFLIAEFKKEKGVDLSADRSALQRLKEAAEKAKHDLSTQMEHDINLPFITMVEGQPEHMLMKLTRAKLEELVGELVTRTLEPVKKALSDSGIDKGEINEILMVGGMTRMPLVQKTVEDFFGKKPNFSVNPDEVVAMGAAIQGAILKGEVKDILLLDVTPLTLAIETAGGVATPMIPRNTTIPTSKSQVFSTYSDNQTAVDVVVTQGERPMAADNKQLGRFTLSGIPPAPRGIPQIEVTFDLDANGILHVKATDKGTGKQQSVSIAGSSTMTDEDKDKAIRDAEENAAKDREKKELVETRNLAESTVVQVRTAMKDLGEKVSGEDRGEIENLIRDVEEVVKNESASVDLIKSKNEALLNKMNEVSQKVYSAGAETAGSTENTQSDAPNNDSVDVDSQAKPE